MKDMTKILNKIIIYLKQVLKKKNIVTLLDKKHVISIQNDDGSIFVVPEPSIDDNKNYSTLKDFTSNAGEIEQQYFWKEVALQAEKLFKKENKVYISASSLDIYYTHVIISSSPNRYPDRLEVTE